MEFGESISSQTICQHAYISEESSHLACTSSASFVSSQEALLVHSPSSLCLPQRCPQGRGLTVDGTYCPSAGEPRPRPAGRGLLGELLAASQRQPCPAEGWEERTGFHTTRKLWALSAGWKGPGGDAAQKAEVAGRELSLKIELNHVLAYIRWVASRARGVVKKSGQLLPTARITKF